MPVKSSLKKLLLIVAIILLFIWAILSFMGIFSFIPPVEYHYQELFGTEKTMGRDYFISINFKSAGAFTAEKKIDVEVEISRGMGKKFIKGNNFIIIGDPANTYEYPLLKREKGLYEGSFINLTVTEDGEKLIGSKSILFNRPGEYPIYTSLIFFNEDNQIGPQSSENKIPISSPEAWLIIAQNNRLFSLTLIIIVLTLISFLIRDKKL